MGTTQEVGGFVGVRVGVPVNVAVGIVGTETVLVSVTTTVICVGVKVSGIEVKLSVFPGLGVLLFCVETVETIKVEVDDAVDVSVMLMFGVILGEVVIIDSVGETVNLTCVDVGCWARINVPRVGK